MGRMCLPSPEYKGARQCRGHYAESKEEGTVRDRSQITIYLSRESEKSMPKRAKIGRKGGRGTPVGTEKHENVRQCPPEGSRPDFGMILC